MRKIFGLTIFIFIFIPAISFSATSSKDSATQPVITSVQDAMKEFKGLTKQERRERIKDVKKEIKQFKAEKELAADTSTNTLLLVILAILLPPLAVYLHEGAINGKFWLDLILTLLFFLPGVIYALIVVLNKK